jgi:hypothetical protein
MASACQRERLRLLSAQAPDDSTAAFLGNLVVSTHTRFQVPDPSVLWSVPAGGLLGSDGHAATPSAATLGCVQGALKRWVAIAISTLLSLACEPPLTRPPWPATSARPSFSGGSRRSPVLVGLVTPVGCPALAMAATSYSRRFGQGAGDCFPALGFSIGPSMMTAPWVAGRGE